MSQFGRSEALVDQLQQVGVLERGKNPLLVVQLLVHGVLRLVASLGEKHFNLQSVQQRRCRKANRAVVHASVRQSVRSKAVQLSPEGVKGREGERRASESGRERVWAEVPLP